MKRKRIFITGIGLVGPGGNNLRSFWESLLIGQDSIATLPNIAPEKFPLNFGGQVIGLEPEQYFNKRFLNKCSRFSVLSLIACRDAIKDAGLNLQCMDGKRVGVFVGNNSGGWESARNGLEVLHTEGPQFVSPFLASNWFPAAPQGHISLAFGIKGFSKTIIADRASSSLAIGYAAMAIKRGHIDIAVVGGVETPLDEWALAFYGSAGIFCSKKADYQPFDNNRSGMVPAEGAAFLILESEKSVQSRNHQEHIQAELLGFGVTNDGARVARIEEKVSQCARAIEIAVNASGRDPAEINHISLDGAANKEDDVVECRAINRAFNGRQDIYATCPKTYFGNTIGASGAFDVSLAVVSSNNSTMLPLANMQDQDLECDLNFVKESPLKEQIKSSLIINRGMGGTSCALIVK